MFGDRFFYFLKHPLPAHGNKNGHFQFFGFLVQGFGSFITVQCGFDVFKFNRADRIADSRVFRQMFLLEQINFFLD